MKQQSTTETDQKTTYNVKIKQDVQYHNTFTNDDFV